MGASQNEERFMQLGPDITAIVTGGASGLGGATARALAAKGAKVALFDLNTTLGEAHAKPALEQQRLDLGALDPGRRLR